MKTNCHHERGQALVMLIVITAAALSLITATTAIVLVNSQAVSQWEQGEEALVVAESGIENALLRSLRDPYYAGETLTIGDSSATVIVSGTVQEKLIISRGTNGNFTRTVRATAVWSKGKYTLESWQEVF